VLASLATTMGPPDAATPPGHPSGAPITHEPGSSGADGSAGVSQRPGTDIERRCADGRPCPEVSARVIAAHVARYVDGDHAEADGLFAAARRWADAHGHGSPARHEDRAVS